jgi:spore coat-associated protein N
VRKFILSALAIILALGLAGAGTFAQLVDTETSTGNSYTAGTMELKVTDDDPYTWDDGCSGTWVLTNIIPGAGDDDVDTVTAYVYLKRSGTINPNHLEIQASISLDENVGQVESDTNKFSTATEMAKKIQIIGMTYGTSNLLNTKLIDADGDGVKTLNDMTYDPDGAPSNGLNNLNIPKDTDPGTTFMLSLQWIAGADDNDFQGDTLNLEVHFTLNQDASQ